MMYVCKTEHVKTGKTHVSALSTTTSTETLSILGTCKANTPGTTRTGIE